MKWCWQQRRGCLSKSFIGTDQTQAKQAMATILKRMTNEREEGWWILCPLVVVLSMAMAIIYIWERERGRGPIPWVCYRWRLPKWEIEREKGDLFHVPNGLRYHRKLFFSRFIYLILYHLQNKGFVSCKYIYIYILFIVHKWCLLLVYNTKIKLMSWCVVFGLKGSTCNTTIDLFASTLPNKMSTSFVWHHHKLEICSNQDHGDLFKWCLKIRCRTSSSCVAYAFTVIS